MPIDAEAVRIASAEIETAFAGLAHRETPNCCIPNAVTMSTSWTSTVLRDWRALSDEFIVRNYATPSGFSAEAFQYHMPAFMVWSLKHHDSIEYTPESTLRALDPDAYGEGLRDFQLSKFALLNLVLHGEKIVHVAIKPLGPNMRASPGVDELRGNPDTVARSADAAFPAHIPRAAPARPAARSRPCS